MYVHLIWTSECDKNEIKEVLDLLDLSDGPLKFQFKKKPPEVYEVHESNANYSMELLNQKEQLPVKRRKGRTWESFFEECKEYRMDLDIPLNDFVVILTTQRNEYNFFTSLDRYRNSFVHIGDWDIYMKDHWKYPVAYEIIANVLRFLMLPEHPANLLKMYHSNTIGCMNDMCLNKVDIMLKLRTGDICEECMQQLYKQKINEQLIDQAIQFFGTISTQLLFAMGFRRNKKLQPITIDVQFELFIGNQKITGLTPLYKTLYYLLLYTEKGIMPNAMYEYLDKLISIYLAIRPGGDPKSIRTLVDVHDGTLRMYKSKINKLIRQQLPGPQAEFYVIEGGNSNPYRIKLPRHQIRTTYKEMLERNKPS